MTTTGVFLVLHVSLTLPIDGVGVLHRVLLGRSHRLQACRPLPFEPQPGSAPHGPAPWSRTGRSAGGRQMSAVHACVRTVACRDAARAGVPGGSNATMVTVPS